MAQIDEAFIQAIDHRRKSTTVEVEFIPVIDLSALKSNRSDEVAALAAEIGRASEQWVSFKSLTTAFHRAFARGSSKRRGFSSRSLRRRREKF